MGIRNLNIELSYAGKGETILRDFLIPVINESINYDRITSFYTVESLLAISQGIESIYHKHGKMRLIIGVHSLPQGFVEASLMREYLQKQISKVREDIQRGVSSLSDELQKRQIATIAWMVEDGLLEIKTAAVEGSGIFHPKTLILSDEENSIAAVGSPNETGSGLGGNYEQIMVATSWLTPEAVNTQKNFFDALWNNKCDDAVVLDITQDTIGIIISALGKEYIDSNRANIMKTNREGIISSSAKMLANYFVSGDIPALYMHQERAVIDALSRWPVRVLFSDEVGLGKTFEVAATMKFLLKYCQINRVVILTPKSVLKQWQDELYENFNINAWLYDSSLKSYVDYNNRCIAIGSSNPLGKQSPDIVLMSAQYARGSGKSKDVFSRSNTILPDLLIVDEAHSARVSKTISGATSKTRMYSMLEQLSRKIPHLILATATPMQKDANEYHEILKLLGLPNVWQKSRNYQTSLKLIANDNIPDISDAANAAKLLSKTILEMAPSTKRLSSTEKDVLDELVSLSKNADQFDLGQFVQDNWDTIRHIFIILHPAHLLTVRNTRRSLSEMGYKFPVRNLHEISIEDSDQIQLFYNNVNEYLSHNCFLVEQELYPDRKMTIGFIRVSYKQRVASSIFSCKKSLERRYRKIERLKEMIDKNLLLSNSLGDEFGLDDVSDVFDIDELFDTDLDEYDVSRSSKIDIRSLRRAIGIEGTALASLLKHADRMLCECGDKKITESIRIAFESLKNNDKVLLFSRYTDTIDALLDEFKRIGGPEKYVYGVYTGDRSVIIENNLETPCDKNEIKKNLFSGKMKIVFCSDAASEGLNLQAARVLVNVDVPWTPARLEQRIGRIARLGQIAEEVEIYNVWYPNSIEANMYHQIQRRLADTNLAIGECPEIIAKSIRESVLDGAEEDTAITNQLKELRNSYQVSALEELWSGERKETVSDVIRKELISICEKSFSKKGDLLGGIVKQFEMPTGEIIGLSHTCGLQETVSLKSLPWKYADFKVRNLGIKKDANGVPYVFAYSNGTLSMTITYEAAIKLILGEKLSKGDYLFGKPAQVPDTGDLNLRYSVDCDLPEAPEYWLDEKKEI